MLDTTAEATIVAVRDALATPDVGLARDLFVTLPGVAHHHRTWLRDVLRDVFMTDRIEMITAIEFLTKLPDPTWALAGCRVLQRAKNQFEWEKIPAIHVQSIAFASLVHQLCGDVTGADLVQAETYWYEWFCPTIHAIILGRPLVIQASERREVLYSVSNASAFDWDRRYVFGWREPWTPKLVEKEQWLFLPVDNSWNEFWIESVAFGELLYVEKHMTFSTNDYSNVRRRVFTWRPNSEPLDPSDKRAHWQLIPVDGSRQGEFMIYNAVTHAYLCSPDDVFDSERRHVLCTVKTPNSSDRVWRILPQRMTAVDVGAAAFYGERYTEAERHLTRALSDEDDFLDTPDRIKCLVLRATSYVRLGKDVALVHADMDKLEQLGGDKAVRAIGLSQLWRESTCALGRPSTIEELTTPAMLFVSLRELANQGDQLFVLKEYAKALDAYERAATMSVDPLDAVLRGRQADAELCRIKCLYALNRPEEALEILEHLSSWIGNDAIAATVRPEAPVQALLWRARCCRKLKRFEDATTTLVRALDEIACLDRSTPLINALERSIQLELEVVRIFEKQLVESLVMTKTEPQPEPADTIAEQLVHSFRCPLSFDFMRDPVMTPSGTTYEREMIEWHLEAVGQWDPMTRHELHKHELYPNRALKGLLETMLSEHKLGTLLASCNS